MTTTTTTPSENTMTDQTPSEFTYRGFDLSVCANGTFISDLGSRCGPDDMKRHYPDTLAAMAQVDRYHEDAEEKLTWAYAVKPPKHQNRWFVENILIDVANFAGMPDVFMEQTEAEAEARTRNDHRY